MGMEDLLDWLSSVQLCYSFKVFLKARYGSEWVPQQTTETPQRPHLCVRREGWEKTQVVSTKMYYRIQQEVGMAGAEEEKDGWQL